MKKINEISNETYINFMLFIVYALTFAYLLKIHDNTESKCEIPLWKTKYLMIYSTVAILLFIIHSPDSKFIKKYMIL